jgi:hypothetical protein
MTPYFYEHNSYFSLVIHSSNVAPAKVCPVLVLPPTACKENSNPLDCINIGLNFYVRGKKQEKIRCLYLIDVAKYIVIGYALSSKSDRSEDDNIQWKLLNESLVDYVVPQLDRIDLSTLIHIRNAANKHFRNYKNLVPKDMKIGFISKIEKMIADLEYINRLFTSPEKE